MNRTEYTWPAIVIGAGAAGLMAAIIASRAGASVLVLETSSSPGVKIRMSGGGRCNVLPSHLETDDFHTSGSLNSLRNILRSWPLAEVRAFFERDLRIELETEPTGKVFPRSGDAREVAGALLRECERSGARLRTAFRVASISRENDFSTPQFKIEGASGEILYSRCLVFATGGLSYPKTGSDGAGMTFARTLGHSIIAPYPALVPLCTKDPRWCALSGLSVRARLRAERRGRVVEEREGDMLFTHRGFSGPVVLELSHHVTRPDSEDVRLRVSWGGSAGPAWDELLQTRGKATLGVALRKHLPARLASLLLGCASIDADQRLGGLPRETRKRLLEILQNFELPISGNEGFKAAEV
ncbi:MAG: aminoacetone oxidase family FAD-binding enzyme, partial [Chitinivibrionia bacterium]|nr:aminoacetone oxidase family FAD-binding enzyme [Chitinivibrionia bacterium]